MSRESDIERNLRYLNKKAVPQVRRKLAPRPVTRERPAPRPVTIVKGQTVYDIGNPKRIGKVTVAGPEVSEVLWTGDHPARQYVTNEYLRIKP